MSLKSLVPLLFLICFSISFSLVYGSNKIIKPAPAAHYRLPHEKLACPRTPLCTMAEEHGYLCEDFLVTTDDGYILAMQRIQSRNHRRWSSSPQKLIPGFSSLKCFDTSKIPVLLMHGVFMDGMTWVLNSPNNSLAFVLADAGYDVWIANNRGTQWSRGHVRMSAVQKEYWEWSWDELMSQDLKTNIEFVCNITKQKMFYAGYAQGALLMLAALSENKYVSMLRGAALLAPTAHHNLMLSLPLRVASNLFIAEKAHWLGIGEFDPKNQLANAFLRKICMVPGINCYNLLTIFTGLNCCTNMTSADLFLRHEFQPTSTRNLDHFSQMVRYFSVKKYDFGIFENMKHYGSNFPPLYSFTNIPKNFPLFISYGLRDLLADAKDVERLLYWDLYYHQRDRLQIHYMPDYAHLDFVLGVNARQLVYENIIGFFKAHSYYFNN